MELQERESLEQTLQELGNSLERLYDLCQQEETMLQNGTWGKNLARLVLQKVQEEEWLQRLEAKRLQQVRSLCLTLGWPESRTNPDLHTLAATVMALDPSAKRFGEICLRLEEIGPKAQHQWSINQRFLQAILGHVDRSLKFLAGFLDTGSGYLPNGKTQTPKMHFVQVRA